MLASEGQKLPPPSFRRRPACMDAGGRAVSGTKAEESSGCIIHSRVSGNDHLMAYSRDGIHLTFRLRLPGFQLSLE